MIFHIIYKKAVTIVNSANKHANYYSIYTEL